MPKLDISLYSHVSPTDLVEIARLADGNDFHNLWLIDSPAAYPDVWTTAALCAVNTSRIRIGPGVTNPVTRHPQVTANAALSIHEISGGRAILGLGTGDSAVRQIGWKPATVSVMGEAVELCRDRFKESGAAIPIYISGPGPKITAYACREADGIISPGGRSPEALRCDMGRIEAVAKETGRDIKNLKIMYQQMFAISHDRRDAIDDMRGPLARILKDIVLDHPEAWPAELEHLRGEALTVAEAYNYKHHMRSHTPNAQTVTDGLVEAFGIAGTPAEVLPKFKAMWQEGQQQEATGLDFSFSFNPVGKGQKRSFELFVREILPQLG